MAQVGASRRTNGKCQEKHDQHTTATKKRKESIAAIEIKSYILVFVFLVSCFCLYTAQLPSVLVRLRKHSGNISTASPTSSLQRHHSALAVQFHLMALLGAPVSSEYVRLLATPSSATSIGQLATLTRLILAIERVTIDMAPKDDHASIRQDCTNRLGEIVTCAMRTPNKDVSVTLGDSTHIDSRSIGSFTHPMCDLTTSDIMQIWMSRGVGATTMLARLIQNNK